METIKIIIICITLMLISLMIMGAWVNTPTELIISFQMDNNTMEAMKSINYSALQ